MRHFLPSLLFATVLLAACHRSTALSPVDAAQSDSGVEVDAPDAGADAPDAPAELMIQIASTPTGDLHAVRVDADGNVTLWGPPLSEAVPPVESVGRVIRGDDGSRLVVQDYTTSLSYVLRDDRWVDLCAEWSATSCYVESHRPDLSRFEITRGFADESSGPARSLMTYEGEELVADSNAQVLFAPDGWTVVSGPSELTTLWDDGRRTTADRRETEVLGYAIGEAFMTYSRDHDAAWTRDAATGARTELLCPDGSSPLDLQRLLRFGRCGRDVFEVDDRGLRLGGHRLPTGSEWFILHVETGSYTVIMDMPRLGVLEASIYLRSPDGELLAAQTRTFDRRTVTSLAEVTNVVQRAKADRYTAYLTFEHTESGHDVVVEREDGIFDWRPGSDPRWFPLVDADRSVYRVWFPETRERALWVTLDGRLLSFDYELGELEDHTGDLSFELLY